MSLGMPKQSSSHFKQIELISLKSRTLSIASYLGLAPFLWFFENIYDDDDYLWHHLSYSLALKFLGFCLLFFQFLAYLMIYNLYSGEIIVNNQVDPANRFSASLDAVNIPIFVTSFLLTFIASLSLWGALSGSKFRIPIVNGLAQIKLVLQTTVILSLILFVLLLAGLGSIVHAVLITSHTPERADVYVLYTQGGYIQSPGLYETYTPPSWAVALAFYPVVLSSADKFGSDRVAILPLSIENFRKAVQNGKFVFIASHGGRTPGSLTFSFRPYVEYRPENVPIGLAGDQLEFVYFAGCDAGRRENAWHYVLGYKQAIMFDRISLVGEHLVWVWTKSPAVIYNLH